MYVLGIRENRWLGTRECSVGDCILYGIEETNNRYVVELIIGKWMSSTLISSILHSEGVILLKLRGKPTNTNLIERE